MKKRPTPTNGKTSALDSADSTDSRMPDVGAVAAVQPRVNQRQRRALDALWLHPNGVMREELDRMAGCSNAPQLVRDLKDKGADITCEIVEVFDRDGNRCRSGRYALSVAGRAMLAAWGWVE